MNRAELIANAEELIVAAGRNLNEVTASLQDAPPRSQSIGAVFDLLNAQTGLAMACIDLARLK